MATLFNEYEKAVSRLEDALNQNKNEFIRDSVIQRFEFCVELAWKTSKKIMGASTTAPKDVIREMAQSGYIEDAQSWLFAIDMRNLSSHTYKEDMAEKVYGFAAGFLPQLKQLLSHLQATQNK
ncbi:MAG: HI0074 family nucleotidyltransferase substrate-binding subunit [Bdellovibrionales bacterium]|nr:HI0074 family nucleotidyltransferase substrate-binding subunit [Bdellovibrionales bacterium]